MPRFFFDFREGSRFVADTKGIECRDLNAAEREAAETVAELGRDLLPKGDARDITAEVRNEHGQRVLTIRLRMDVDRVEPPPEPPEAD